MHPDATPREALQRLHYALLAQHGRSRLVTAALALLRPGSDGVTGTLCSAGHVPPLIRRISGRIDIPADTRPEFLGVTVAQRCHRLDADGILNRVQRAVAEHNGGYHPYDTAIMVILA